MDCNKEEAIKAKDLAVLKMQNGDFVGARRIASRAQQLYSDLDDITQLLVVCEVHCSAQKKLHGSEMDWYGILQIDKFSDEAVIKKQFRKLALVLHPDKNKFAGAEAAFKLIGEANRVLTDPIKRPTYDVKCRSPFVPFVPKPAFDQSFKNAFVQKQHGTANVFASHTQHSPRACQPPPHQTFWTTCPSCNTRFQYHREYVKKMLRCQNCQQPYVAHDLGVPLGSSMNQFLNKKKVPNQDPSKVSPQYCAGMSSSHRFPGSDSVLKAEKGADVDGTKSEEVKVKKEPGTSESATNKRCRKQEVGLTRNSDVGSRVENAENKVKGKNDTDISSQNSRPNIEQQFRRSSRRKQQISYKESFEDDDADDADADVILPSKRSRGDVSSKMNDAQLKPRSVLGRVQKGGSDSSVLNENYKEVKRRTGFIIEERSQISPSEKNSNKTLKSEVFVCADPNVSNFERARAEDCFAINQVWALYDSDDGMPRFYAVVKKVFSPGFKLQIAWLEATSNNKAEQQWCNEGLSVGCGTYKIGDTEEITTRMMFSHRMNCLNGGDTYLIYPKKGETWALFKDWNVEWSLEAEKHRSPHQFEYVEVVTDFMDDVGIGVAYLGKMEGYVSMFQQTSCDEVLAFCIEPSEMYRFSHRIPSCRITGREGKGIPEGSFEFDTAALPSNISSLVDTEKISMFEKVENGRKLETSTHGSPLKGSIDHCKNNDRVDAGQKGGSGNRVASHGKSTRSKESNSCQADEKILTDKRREENNFTAVSLTPRRSPRDLGTRSNGVKASQLTAEDNKHSVRGRDQRDGRSGASSRQPDDEIHLDGKDGRSISPSKGQSSSTSKVVEIDDYDFKQEKSEDKFQVGQIWAVHSGMDMLPKNYAQVIKIESKTDFRLHVAMLETGTLQKEKLQPASCGTFRVKTGKPTVLLSNEFSHQVKATLIRRNAYEIYPRKGEIWAVYKNWNPEMTCSDESKLEYGIVEIVEDDSRSVKAVVLRPVKGLDNFYMLPIQKRLKVSTLEIPRTQFSRFSHHCSAYQHLIEKDGILRGFWQLNPTSVPGNVIVIE